MPSPEVDLLTDRERDIVRLLAQGMSNAEIADSLVVETTTVTSHLSRAMTKLGARDRVRSWSGRTATDWGPDGARTATWQPRFSDRRCSGRTHPSRTTRRPPPVGEGRLVRW